MEEIDARDVLAGIPLFREALDNRQIAHLAAQCEVVAFPAGALIMAEGDFGDSMFAIVEGDVSVTVHDRRGDEHGVALLMAGDIVGEMSLMTGARRAATVEAVTSVVAVEITKFALEGIFTRAPELIDRFALVLAARAAKLKEVTAEADSHVDLVGRIRRIFGGR